MALHRDLTGADLHEPKGADSAAANTVYIFNGSGSGSPQKIGVDSLNLAGMGNPNDFYLSTTLDDISSPGFTALAVSESCQIISIVGVLEGPITTADATVSFSRVGVGSLGAPIIIPFSGSAKGTFFIFTATNNRDLVPGQFIQITSDGASDGAQRLFLVAKFTRTFV